jgi:hypothetical protein
MRRVEFKWRPTTGAGWAFKSVSAFVVITLYLVLQSRILRHVDTKEVKLNAQQQEDGPAPPGPPSPTETINGWAVKTNLPFPPRHDRSNPAAFLSPYDPTRNPHRSFLHPKPILPPGSIQKHPYLGATDEQGRSGYIANVRAHLEPAHAKTLTIPINTTGSTISNDKQKDPHYHSICSPPDRTNSDWMGYQVLQDHIQISPPPPSHIPSRILCVLYTHAQAKDQTDAIRETWGRKCDGLLLTSTITDPASSLHVRIRHASRGEGTYRALWQRMRAILAYIYQHYMKDFDYFHLCGDDTFVIVENLRAYVASPSIANLTLTGQPFLGGFWSHWRDQVQGEPDNFYYMGGGAGYTLNAKSLQLYAEHALTNCSQNRNDNAMEDLFVSWCFRERLNVVGWDTRDEQEAHRYHVLSQQQHALFPTAGKYGTSSNIVRKSLVFMQRVYGFPVVYGKDYISTNSVAFHKYKTPEDMKRMEYYLYGSKSAQQQCESILSSLSSSSSS